MATRKPRKHNPEWADNTTKERQRSRDAAINEKLEAAGWSGKSEFLTAILNGDIAVPPKPTATDSQD